MGNALRFKQAAGRHPADANEDDAPLAPEVRGVTLGVQPIGADRLGTALVPRR